MKIIKIIFLFFIIPAMVLGALACQTLQSLTGPKATLEIAPAEIFLSPALIRKPVTFKGSGFAPKEMISVEMVLPPGLKMKGITEGEDVGIAVATSDEKGNFTAAMGPMATLNWFFQVGWTPLLKPNFKEARPVPPGVYTINATGLDSDRVATSTLKIVPPPKKK
ncbi:MAG: hypothetical protein JRF06_00335 [Deltaproteobacteria bacterium]|nr:hypothetical protein [Deltaproteobacteria bacterium]MBW2333542.1 hypothetical protein [Deltaproteobacteria bacterium]